MGIRIEGWWEGVAPEVLVEGLLDHRRDHQHGHLHPGTVYEPRTIHYILLFIWKRAASHLILEILVRILELDHDC